MRLLIVSVSLAVGLVLSGCTQQCCGPDGVCYEYQGGGSCPGGYSGGGAGPSGSYGSYSSSGQGAQDACCYSDGTCCAADAYGNCPTSPPAGGTTGGVTVVPGIHGHGTSTSATSSSGGSDSAGQTSGGTSGGTSSGTTGDSTGTTGGSTGTTGSATGTAGGSTGTTGGGTGTTGGSTGGGSGTSGSGGTSCDAGVLIGTACSCDSECGANQVCVPSLNYSSNPDAPTQWSNGYCTVYNCDLANPCPGDAICYQFPQGSASLYSLCLASCTSSACDRSGYTCGEIGDPVAACLPECVHDCDCSAGLVCESGSCQQPCYVDTQCGPNEVCNGNHCQAGPPLACCDLPGMAPCPNGMACQSGTCVIACTYDVDCPAGERCQSNGNCG